MNRVIDRDHAAAMGKDEFFGQEMYLASVTGWRRRS
jgi:hypothetical protein